MSKKDVDRVTDAARPLLEYLNEFHHPHTTVIVTPTSVEVLESTLSNPKIFDYIKD